MRLRRIIQCLYPSKSFLILIKSKEKICKQLSEMSWDEISKNREASFYSMKNILLHMIDNEDWIVNWVIHNKAQVQARQVESDEYSDMSQILSSSIALSGTKKYLSEASEEELNGE